MGITSKILVSFYQDSEGKSFKSEKHYNWFLGNKDTQEYKNKKRLLNQSYYKRKGETLRKNRVSEYHKTNPDARYNDHLVHALGRP